MSDRLTAEREALLLPFLVEELPGWPRNTVKKRLQSGCVLVNGKRVTRHDHALSPGDRVEVLPKPSVAEREEPRFEVLYDDDGLVAIHKPAGLLSVGATEGDEHALALLREQLAKVRRNIKLWPIHRLDRETSGVLLFATDPDVRADVTAAWSESEKVYLGIVEGTPKPPSRTIDLPLRMDAAGFRAIVGPDPDALDAVTHYEVVRTQGGRTLLTIRIDTGRQHQIRAHLAAIGHPLVGDDRYGNGRGRMGLHALSLSIPSPTGDERLTFEAKPPPDFLALLGPRRR